MSLSQIWGVVCFAMVVAGTSMLYGQQDHRVVQVTDETGLRNAIDQVKGGDEIVLADGVYEVSKFLWLKNAENIIIRSASRDPKKTILRGQGFYKVFPNSDILWIEGCANVTIEGLSFEEAQDFGIKIYASSEPKNINILSCRFFNIGVRHIKGTASSKHEMAVGGSVRDCYFENTDIPPKTWLFDGNYIAAIDMMCLDGWTFSDNKFVNIKGASGGGRAAIFIWVESQNITVERNIIIGCDRGIAFGNPSGSSNYAAKHVSDSICRDNFLSNQADTGIELAWVSNVKVYNNTCWRPDEHGSAIRCVEKIEGVELVNNLTRGKLELKEGAEDNNNFDQASDDYFVDPQKGDLHLTSSAVGALGKGVSLPEVTEDIDKHQRKPQPDIGAAEYESSSTP